ncbi:hypothetical protein H311_03682 [Anncaliia algerae PRA109]|nr:hypothetical protein H311_03682 [Anncaliia algerae PRA109]
MHLTKKIIAFNMIFNSRIYIFFFFLYFIKIIGILIYFKFVIQKFSTIGVKTPQISLYFAYMFFTSSFVSFILLTYVFISQKIRMYIPYVIVEGNLVLVSIVLLPFVERRYSSLVLICPMFIKYFMILYIFRNDIKAARYVEAQKYGLNILAQRALKVSLN